MQLSCLDLRYIVDIPTENTGFVHLRAMPFVSIAHVKPYQYDPGSAEDGEAVWYLVDCVETSGDFADRDHRQRQNKMEEVAFMGREWVAARVIHPVQL